MDDALLRADCARCAALCCMAIAFDRSAQFAFDKAAGAACPNLGADRRCSIYADRETRGFAGCVRYDCFGAGQRVTAMFAGRDWRESPALASEMSEAFLLVSRQHRLLALLFASRRLPLSEAQAAERATLEAALGPADAIEAGELEKLEARVRAFMRSLRSAAEAYLAPAGA